MATLKITITVDLKSQRAFRCESVLFDGDKRLASSAPMYFELPPNSNLSELENAAAYHVKTEINQVLNPARCNPAYAHKS